MPQVSFNARIGIYKDGNPFVAVSALQARRIKTGWRKPMPVLVQVNGKPDEPWHINMVPAGDGSFVLYLHGDLRKASGTKVGDMVAVTLRFDESYQGGPQHDIPDWFSGPLYKHATARKHWESLTPSRQKEILRYFSWLKSGEAKQRNVEKALFVLGGGKGRFMAQSWQGGRVITRKEWDGENQETERAKKYAMIEKAIVSVLGRRGEMTFGEIMVELQAKSARKFDGSIRYAALVVQSNLIGQGILERIPGKTPTLRLRLQTKKK